MSMPSGFVRVLPCGPSAVPTIAEFGAPLEIFSFADLSLAATNGKHCLSKGAQ
jgi:hypothetical protein